ncbi:amidohydrolase family protein [Agromyces seonyuensis]|uniref:Amidohydrolase family protein n=1 Tax=Agromyces seonyuensis TaxID=2662446 RepID=A0A6I4NXV7_9MICO|nr:amidohydrolase family protein [Agromyces seonyuensis]
MSAELILAGARFAGADDLVDVHVADGRIAAIGPADSLAGGGHVERLDLDGRTLVPGLVDGHVHFSQWAQAARRFDVSGATSAAEAVALAGAARDRAAGPDPVVGFGYRDGLWPDAPSVAALEERTAGHPVLLISADLHSAWLNRAALTRFGADPATEGLLREDDAFAVLRALEAVEDDVLDGWTADAARTAAARGVTGITDLEMRWNLDDWRRRAARSPLDLRVAFGVYTLDLDRALALGLATGQVVAGTDGLVEVGPYKVITDGSLNTRTAWCFDPYEGLAHDAHPHGLSTVPFDELVPLLERASAGGFRVAVHAIGDRANAVVLDAFAATGAQGSVEHAQLLRHEDVARFAELGVVASVQPEHAMDDRDVAERYWAGRTDRAFLLRDLADAGVELALGSDAPVAPLDPWISIAAAVERSRDGRTPWHPEQSIEAAVALAASTGGRGIRPAVGEAADLAVLGADPLRVEPAELRTLPVALTLLAGRITHDAR